MRRDQAATERVTYKCAGCGRRKPDGTQYVPPVGDPVAYSLTCSPACLEQGEQRYWRQRWDRRLLALVGH